MNDKLQMRGTEEIARRWRALVEQRREHFADLYHSGRWRKYYREHDFFIQMRETARMIDAWSKVAPADGGGPR